MFILIALFIDGLQACISLGLFFIASTAGTTGGAAAGCIAGSQLAGTIGCWLGGALLGVFGTLGNAFAAPVLIPIGIALGFAINMCLSATLGSGLIFLMWLNGIFYPRYALGGGMTELVPGFDNLPAWTLMVILSLSRKKAEEAGISVTSPSVSIFSMGSFTDKAARTISQANRAAPARSNVPEREEPGARIAAEMHAPQLKNIDGVRPPASDNALQYAKTA